MRKTIQAFHPVCSFSSKLLGAFGAPTVSQVARRRSLPWEDLGEARDGLSTVRSDDSADARECLLRARVGGLSEVATTVVGTRLLRGPLISVKISWSLRGPVNRDERGLP
jgi:hypothetical protein